MDNMKITTFSILHVVWFSVLVSEANGETLETKVDRLSDRLSLLDSKVALDLISMRQDLEDVKNEATVSTQGGVARTGTPSINIKDLKTDVDSLRAGLETCYSRERALLTAFKTEKRRRRMMDEKLESFKSEALKDLKDKVGELLENTQRETVSFSARALLIKDLKPWETIVFPDVANNRGGAFNGTSGLFVVPISGTYIFYCNILSNKYSFIEVALQVNGFSELLIYSTGGDNLGAGSNMVVVDLDEGDIVNVVKYGPWGTRPFYVHNTWSTFSGFLLFKADKH